MIGSALLDTGNFEKHLITRDQKKKYRKKTIIFSLMLTSMVDMFSMLVCFLLQTFSSTPEVLVTKGVALPEAISGKEVKEAPVIAVSKEKLFLDQKLVGKTEVVLREPWELIKRLIKFKKNWVRANPNKPFPGRSIAGRSLP